MTINPKPQPDHDVMQQATPQRSTPEIIAELVAADDPWEVAEAEHWPGICELHRRGGRIEFEAARDLCASAAVRERIVGAEILAQLGMAAATFVEASRDILIGMLDDSEPLVLQSAGIALGHRLRHGRSRRASAALVALADHPAAIARYGAVHGLSGDDDPAAVDALIRLSRDTDRDVRDWATFALAGETFIDTPEIRDALLARCHDEDPECRGEALIGLARRGDERVLPALERELLGEFHGSWAIEAAQLLKASTLLPLLLQLQARLRAGASADWDRFGADIEAALATCRNTPAAGD
ncbi:MAG: HEAT repeat domain-containing protein [Hyphomicrobiaceae bacterium]|nr:HEAT repeat domain-containing protein [Hyphomicrobiaceae bacterium]